MIARKKYSFINNCMNILKGTGFPMTNQNTPFSKKNYCITTVFQKNNKSHESENKSHHKHTKNKEQLWLVNNIYSTISADRSIRDTVPKYKRIKMGQLSNTSLKDNRIKRRLDIPVNPFRHSHM